MSAVHVVVPPLHRARRGLRRARDLQAAFDAAKAACEARDLNGWPSSNGVVAYAGTARSAMGHGWVQMMWSSFSKTKWRTKQLFSRRALAGRL